MAPDCLPFFVSSCVICSKPFAVNWKEFSAGYLHFTRRDRIGIFVILFLIGLLLLLPRFFPGPAGLSTSDTTWIASLQKAEQRLDSQQYRQGEPRDENTAVYQYDRSESSYSTGPLFYFDPNTLPAADWERTGLRARTIQTILNYRAKGGRFRSADDLRRIYGLRPAEYERLAPYIRIAEQPAAAGMLYDGPATNSPAARPRSYIAIDINTADTTAWIALPGIGSKLAARIVNFREKLGGFYSVSQVAETYGLPDSTFQKIKAYLQLTNPSVKKININTATVEELKAHPYIRYSLANPIVAYRKEHGPFSATEAIKKIAAVTDELYSKIAPYLTIE